MERIFEDWFFVAGEKAIEAKKVVTVSEAGNEPEEMRYEARIRESDRGFKGMVRREVEVVDDGYTVASLQYVDLGTQRSLQEAIDKVNLIAVAMTNALPDAVMVAASFNTARSISDDNMD